jgi:hypothetical protein
LSFLHGVVAETGLSTLLTLSLALAVATNASAAPELVAQRRVLLDPDNPPSGVARRYGPIRETCPRETQGTVNHRILSAEHCGGGRACLRVEYAFATERPTETGLRLELSDLDASAYDHLELLIRGDPSIGFDRDARVGFKRPHPTHRRLVVTGSAHVSGIESRWRRLLVPLDRMTGIRNWKGLTEMFLSLHPSRSKVHRGAYEIAEIAVVRTGKPRQRAWDSVRAEKKQAWVRSIGGSKIAKAKIKARLRGWPSRLLVPRAELPSNEREFLQRLARDTWRGLDALADKETGLPLDHVRFRKASTDPAKAKIGDYTSTTNIGLYMLALAAARELELLSEPDAIGRLTTLLGTVERLASYKGFLFNFYDTISLERTSNFVSFVDSAWLTAGLMVTRVAFPSLRERCTALIEREDYDVFFDEAEQLMSHGYYVHLDTPSEYHYGLLYTEARVGSLIAIGKGDVPEEHWFRMMRALPAGCGWQRMRPSEARAKQVRGHEVVVGYYEWEGLKYVPSWGGSMFEALMPTLVIDENRFAPYSLARNNDAHARIQRRYAVEKLGYPVWGISPSASPGDGYGEYGVEILGSLGYPAGVVTPHASALALEVMPAAAAANLRALATRYPLYGEYGFYDAVDPLSGKAAHAYLALDQSMLLVALANYLKDGCIQKYFASDPIAGRALPLLSAESFFD